MPKSRRQRTKALTKVDKKTSDLKQKVVESVREAVDSYATVFAFSFVNMRTNHFKDVRMDFRDSRYAHYQSLYWLLHWSVVLKVALGSMLVV